ncbi:MAG TPA: ABC transporter permease subunit [Chloroflexia bacterium]|nr:ABC transporter permease subunit [Chloroflexia bacterium]
MLRNAFFKTLRDYRWQILLWGAGLAILMVAQVQAYYNFFRGPDKDTMLADYRQAAESFSFFFGKVYDVETLGGYIHFEIMIYLPVLLGIFALMAGSAIIRGEEEKEALDLLLSTPHSRVLVLLQKAAAVTVAVVLIAAIGYLSLVIGAAVAGVELSAGGAALAHLNIVLVALLYGSVALFFAQLVPSRKAAAGWAGGFLAAGYLMNSMGQSIEGLRWLRSYTPFYYYDLSKPMAKSVGTDWGAISLLAFLILPFLAGALLMYLKRDHSGVFQLPAIGRKVEVTSSSRVTAPKAPWLFSTFTFGLKSSLFGVIVWGLGMAAYEVMVLGSFNGMRDSIGRMLSNDFFRSLGFTVLPSNESMVDLIVFIFLLPLCAAYAIIQVAGWAGEESNGRLELLLSIPIPRWRLLIGRFVASICASALTVGITGLGFALCCQFFNITINTGNALEAFVGLWVICVLVAATGYLLAAFGPSWAVAVSGTLVVVSYVLTIIGPALKLPDWTIDLSFFHQYGKPLVEGLNWTATLVMLAVSVVFLALGVFRFWKRDLAK